MIWWRGVVDPERKRRWRSHMAEHGERRSRDRRARRRVKHRVGLIAPLPGATVGGAWLW